MRNAIHMFDLSEFSLNYVKPISLHKVLNYVKPISLHKVETAIIGLNYLSVWISQSLIMQVPQYIWFRPIYKRTYVHLIYMCACAYACMYCIICQWCIFSNCIEHWSCLVYPLSEDKRYLTLLTISFNQWYKHPPCLYH